MLYSIEKCVSGKRPAYMAWFGNFFEPYFSSERAVDQGLLDLRELGINSVVLDSKLWSDFSRHFRTGELSPYVKMQKYISDKCNDYGLGVSFLALFAIGDNLYPEIYDHPPEFVDQPVDFWGRPYRGYRHWSSRQMDEHVRHCLELYRFIARDAQQKQSTKPARSDCPFIFITVRSLRRPSMARGVLIISIGSSVFIPLNRSMPATERRLLHWMKSTPWTTGFIPIMPTKRSATCPQRRTTRTFGVCLEICGQPALQSRR